MNATAVRRDLCCSRTDLQVHQMALAMRLFKRAEEGTEHWHELRRSMFQQTESLTQKQVAEATRLAMRAKLGC